MAKKRPKPGSIVRVVFVDHCMSSGLPTAGMEFECIGRLTHIEKGVWIIRVWGEPDVHEHDENSNSFSIIESTITKMEILK